MTDARDLALEGFWPGRVSDYSIALGGLFASEIAASVPATAQSPPKKQRRAGGGGWEEEDDPYFDENIAAENEAIVVEAAAEAELADLSAWAQLVVEILADQVSTEVAHLETFVVVESLQISAAPTSAVAGSEQSGLESATAVEASASGVGVDTLDVTITVDDD